MVEAMSQTYYTKIITNPSPRTNQSLALVRGDLETKQAKGIPKTKLSLNVEKKRSIAAARCVASGSGYAAAIEPIMTAEEEDELTQRRRICGGEENIGRGVWELLECLEKEAIMGDDNGRDPKDYSRRAKIFDKTSKIVKNIKEHRDESQE